MLRRSLRFPSLGSLALCLAVSAGLAAQSPATELPVSRVVLYSSGVGFFEHAGMVSGDTTVRFSFKTDQINDLLKSMVLRDSGGGSVGTVTYASQDPVARALKSFAVDLSDQPDLASLLARLRGAAVTVMAPQAINGTILGVENRPRTTLVGGEPVISNETWLNLLGADGLRSLNAASIVSIKLADPRLNDELARALALIIQGADTQRRSVDVQFKGQGQRKVTVDYIAEAPVWKTSYRLDLSGGGFLQGWAIVENSSDADWEGVSLSLASGSPVSFTQDLYTPLYVTRPAVAPQVQAQVAPKAYDEGMDQLAGAPGPGSRAAPAPAPAAMMQKSRAMAEEADAYSVAPAATGLSLAQTGIAPAASGQKLGELFNFAVKAPVSLARRQSAMIPLLSQEINAEKVSIYNQSVLAKNPMSGAVINNGTGLRLPPGPITVFDAGMYAGDALLDSFGENDKRLVSYAVDLDTSVDPSQSSSNQITKLSIVRGVLSIQRLSSFTQVWKIQNRAKADKTLIIEHPKTAGRSLVSPKEAMEQTASLYRFKLKVPKSSTVEYQVVEQLPGTETVALLGSRAANLQLYLSYDKATPAIKAALQKAIELRQKADTVQEDIRAATQSKAEIENGQGRLRSNIDTVGRDTPQGQRYLQKLLEGEDQIDQLAARIASLQTALKNAQAELENYLKTLQVE